MENQVILTSAQLVDLASGLNDIIDTLGLQQLAQESFTLLDGRRTEWDLIRAREFHNLTFNQNQRLIEKLEDISGILANNDNATEVAAYYASYQGKGA